MSERRFDIIFDGSVINGSDPLAVKERVQQLFKLDASAAEKLFSGNPIVIKKSVDRKTATQYQQAMTKAGAKIQMVLHKVQANQSESDAQETDASQESEPSWTLAELGTLLGTNASSSSNETPSIDTSHLTLLENRSSNPFLDQLDQLPQNQGEYMPCYPLPEIESAPVLDIKSEREIEDESAAIETRLSESCGKMIEELSGDFGIASAGEDLLSPDEKQKHVAVEHDLSAYTIKQD